MTHAEIIRIALRANHPNPKVDEQFLVKFANLIALETKEECAKLCQSVVDGPDYDGWQAYAAAACRDAIRGGTGAN